jgi:sulfite exporter TauE/SafE
MDLGLVFITGLTTGGLTCLAVQGGLLMTALSQGDVSEDKLTFADSALPVGAFLGAKLVAYAILGFLLGGLGTAFRITPTVQGIMQVLAGLFMIATAFSLLDVHPIFRYLQIKPPKFITRRIRAQAKSDTIFAPAILGAMTIFIPCGITQSMMILAISSSSPFEGMAIMTAFTFGTTPVFFVLGLGATQLRGRMQAVFSVVTATLVLLLGLLAFDAGLVLLDSPISPSRIVLAMLNPDPPAVSATIVDGRQEFYLTADSNGYTPNVLLAESGLPIRLNMVTQNARGCELAFTIPSLGLEMMLPTDGVTPIDIPAPSGGEIRFACSMGMYTGVIKVS